MAPAHSHPHSPSSATSYTAQAPTVSSNIRRNLFSAHLSRRPASSTHSPTEASAFIPPLSPTSSPERSPSPTAHSLSRTNISTRHCRSSDAIIATYPNGRPQLPLIPRLPAHLRLSTMSDDDATHAYELTDEASRNDSPTRYNHTASLADSADAEDAARIEKGLVELMWRQRQRVTGVVASPLVVRSANGDEEGKSREEEELMGLIMERLREKVAVLESEGWMYGESGESGVIEG